MMLLERGDSCGARVAYAICIVVERRTAELDRGAGPAAWTPFPIF